MSYPDHAWCPSNVTWPESFSSSHLSTSPNFLFLNGWASQPPSCPTQKPGNYRLLHSRLVSTSKQSPRSPSVYSPPSLWPATALVQVLVISYFDFCSFITDQMVWLWASISLIHSPYGSQIPHYHVSSSAVPHCHQDETKLFTVICNALSDLVSASSPESCLSPTPHTPTNPPAFLDIIHLLRLSSYSLQPHIWSPCCYMNMPVPFTSGTFHLAFFLPGKFFHARESQGLFSSWLSAFYSKISLKPFPTALFKNVGCVSQLPQTPPPPLLFF